MIGVACRQQFHVAVIIGAHVIAACCVKCSGYSKAIRRVASVENVGYIPSLKRAHSDYNCRNIYALYRAMHFSAKRGLAIACRLSVCDVGGLDFDHIGWNSSEIISPLVSLGCSLSADPTSWVYCKGNTRKF